MHLTEKKSIYLTQASGDNSVGLIVHMPSLTSVLQFCETQWRHSMKQGYITPPPPYFILWNAVTSLGENKGYIRPPPPYFIVLASSVKIKEVKVIEFHRMLRRATF